MGSTSLGEMAPPGHGDGMRAGNCAGLLLRGGARRPQQCNREYDHDYRRRPTGDVIQAAVFVLSHQFRFVHQDEHENQDEGQNDAVHHLLEHRNSD